VRNLDRTAPVGDLRSATLRLSYGASRLTITSGAIGPDLYRAHFEVSDNVRTTTSLDPVAGVVAIGINNRAGFCFFGCGEQRSTLRLTLNQALPWKLVLSGGASNGELDLRSAKLSGLQVSGGANHLDIQLPAPSGEVPLSFEGGATSVDISAPAGSQSRIQVSGGASALEVDGARSSGLGHQLSHQSDAFASATDRYVVEVSGGANHVSWSASG
jgi:hypothetical protein